MIENVSVLKSENFKESQSQVDARIVNSERAKQERYGVILLNTQFLFPRCVIVAFCWPSILWSLNLVSREVSYMLYVGYGSAEERKEIKACFSNVTIIDDQECKQYMQTANTFIIGQGDVTLLWNYWMAAGKSDLNRTILICAFNRMKQNQFGGFNVKWTRFKHKKIGGLTNSQFLIGIAADLWTTKLYGSISNLNLSRSLLDIVDQGQVGKPAEVPEVNSYLDTWLLSEASTQACYPSYRSSTGWVTRSLTLKEKALCLDMNELTLDRVLSPTFIHIRQLIEVGGLYPVKICQIVATWMYVLWSIKMEEEKKSNPTVEDKEDQLDSLKESSLEDENYLKFEQNYLESYGQKASKNDDDEVPVELWDRAILRDKFCWLPYTRKVKLALRVIRNKLAFRWYLRTLRMSLFKYLRKIYGKEWWNLLQLKTMGSRKRKFKVFRVTELQKDLMVATDALNRASRSTWWEWRDGSTCFFWRWPKEVRSFVRDGFPVHVESRLPVYRQRQVFHLKGNEMQHRLWAPLI